MEEIRYAVYDLLETDEGIQNKTGYTVSDTRIYEEFPPDEITISSTYPAYITYKFMAPGSVPSDRYVQKAGYPDIICELNVYAKTSALRDELAERIDLILKDKEWNTDNWRALRTNREGSEDIPEIHPGTQQLIIKRKYMRFRISEVFRK